MALPNVSRQARLVGHASPRLAPPVPAQSEIKAFRETAKSIGIDLMPWQDKAGRYITATTPDGQRLYREVCVVVARQNGKTTLAKPLIIKALREGRRVMHIAQNRELPRHMFSVIAESLDESLFPKRRGKGGKLQTVWPRYGAGQEEIILANGATYRIAAARNGGARGWSNDLVIIDELLEMESMDILNAVEPTLRMSPDPQLVYFSNAGSDASVVLNSVRKRRDNDPGLAYLEWSAAPGRAVDDVKGWAEANPALGHYPSVMRELEASYRRAKLGGNLSGFETESLCRWVATMRERLVDEYAWSVCGVDGLAEPVRAFMGISMDPSGTRASAALAWQTDDEGIGLRLLFDVTGDPIDTDALGNDLRDTVLNLGVTKVGFDPMTDAEFAKFFKKPEPIAGQKYANATARFVTAVKARKLHWFDADAVSDDLTWTARQAHEVSGSYQAVRAKDDRPITAVLAAIRAVWLASGPLLEAPAVY